MNASFSGLRLLPVGYFEDHFEDVEHLQNSASQPPTWQHLGPAKITNQTPSSLPLGTQTDPITPEHADTCAGGKTNKKATECGVKETHTCTRYLQYFTP